MRMIIREESFVREVIHNMKGGKGDFYVEHLVGREELGKAGSMFARTYLKSGDSVGMHVHEHNIEICYFISGEGMVIEDGKKMAIHAGDVNYVPVGKNHEIINTGKEDLVYMAVVLNP